VLSRISPHALHTCFLSWTQALNVNSDGLIIAIDGKTVRRSHNRREGRAPLHLVRAWATEAGIALGQMATEVKSNEITAIPELLHQLELKGAVVTIDAMGCQRAIAEQITAQKGDYVLALKGNQSGLNDAVRDYFMTAKAHDFQGVDFTYNEQLNTGHGRIEQRRCWACADLSTLPETKPWAGLTSIIMVESERHVDDKITTEQRFFISSLKPNADKIAPAIRAHNASVPDITTYSASKSLPVPGFKCGCPDMQAVMVTDTAFYRYDGYHEPSDTAERLDYRRVAMVVDGVFAAIVVAAEKARYDGRTPVRGGIQGQSLKGETNHVG
jgi:predicted transposase YbfD/YdcC